MELEKYLKVKPNLVATRKVGGRIVKEEMENLKPFSEEDMGDLLNGVTASEIESGREKLMAENPTLASEQIRDIMNINLTASEQQEVDKFNDPRHMAAIKRVGKIADRTTGETSNFKRLANNSIELTSDEGEILGTFSSKEFNDFLDAENLMIL
jgi:hypothetical protein